MTKALEGGSGACLAPVSMSMRKMEPSLDTENAVASSDVTASAVTGNLRQNSTGHLVPVYWKAHRPASETSIVSLRMAV